MLAKFKDISHHLLESLLDVSVLHVGMDILKNNFAITNIAIYYSNQNCNFRSYYCYKDYSEHVVFVTNK
jgi:hypothetical protein